MVNEHPEWDPSQIVLSDENVPDDWKICVIQGVFGSDIEYNGSMGARISSIFVIFFVSTFCTMFPLLAKKFPKLKIPLYGYLFARYFGTGVIVATAFIHLMDPAYGAIGGNTCVGMTGNWAIYSWCPAIMLTSVFAIFLLDVLTTVVVDRKFGIEHSHSDKEVENAIIKDFREPGAHVHNDADEEHNDNSFKADEAKVDEFSLMSDEQLEVHWAKEFGAFLLLEFGIIFHSIMIGLNLGTTGDEFKTLYIVLVFHQSFEGLGIGARLSAIPWPKSKPTWMPWVCCLVYGFVTPICIAIGLGVRNTYMGDGYTVQVVSGVLDSISAGLLLFNGLVELLARDFIFDKNATKDLTRLSFSLIVTLFGAGIMALLGKWA